MIANYLIFSDIDLLTKSTDFVDVLVFESFLSDDIRLAKFVEFEQIIILILFSSFAAFDRLFIDNYFITICVNKRFFHKILEATKI